MNTKGRKNCSTCNYATGRSNPYCECCQDGNAWEPAPKIGKVHEMVKWYTVEIRYLNKNTDDCDGEIYFFEDAKAAQACAKELRKLAVEYTCGDKYAEVSNVDWDALRAVEKYEQIDGHDAKLVKRLMSGNAILYDMKEVIMAVYEHQDTLSRGSTWFCPDADVTAARWNDDLDNPNIIY